MSFLTSSVLADAIPDSAISRWTFDNDDTESGTAIDIWGSNNGTINGATTGVAGANQTYNTNEAYSFDGSNDNVEVADDATLEAGSGFTVAVWVNADDLTNIHHAISKSDGGDGPYQIRSNSGNLEYYIKVGGTNYIINFGTVSTGTWYHLVATYDGETMITYRDGSQINSDSTPSGVIDTQAVPLHIGSRGGDREWPGEIDDPRLYSKPLSSTEVSNLYNTGRI